MPYLYITVPANTGVLVKFNLSFFSFHIRSRNFDSSWINIIKDTILNSPGGIVTVFPVMPIGIYIYFIHQSKSLGHLKNLVSDINFFYRLVTQVNSRRNTFMKKHSTRLVAIMSFKQLNGR